MRKITPFSAYLASVIVAGGVVFVVAFMYETPREMIGPRPGLFLTFSALLLLAESRPVMWLRRKQGAVITAAPSFNAALLFLAPGLGAAVASGVLSAIGDLTCGRPPLKTTFNAAMMTVTVAVPSVLLQLGGQRLALIEGGEVTLAWMGLAAFALLAQNVINDMLVAVVVALSERLPVLAALKGDLLRNLQTDGVLLALGPVMVVVAVRSMLLLPVLLVVTIIVLNTTRMALERLHQATHDPLTGLPNRRLFDQHLQALLTSRAGSDNPVAVMVMDLDRFKEINDTLGHEIGDRVLVAVAQRLQASVPHSGMVARLGGDEFAILLADVPHDRRIEDIAERIHRSFTGSMDADGLPLSIAGSVGIALQTNETTTTQIMRRADLAMYQAKSAGGGVRLHLNDGVGAVGGGRLALLDQLSPAIARDQLFLQYQPIVNVITGEVDHIEALVRWQHPDHGLVPPSEFIPTAEQTDLIGPLTTWVLNRAMQDCALFAELGQDVGVAVNLSSRSVTDLTFPRHLRGLISASGLHPSRLTLELTENTIVGDAARATQVMGEIKKLGVNLALDDFGTGFSSLSNLRELPLDTVKIDRSFVTHMDSVPMDAAIVTAVLALAEQLGIKVVAEGIEDEGVLRALRELGCDYAQGYFIARPMTFEHLAEWLASRPSWERTVA